MKQLFLCLGLLAIAGFFIFNNAQAISNTLLISQVQTGAPNKSHNDFIRLFNASDAPFDLDGHRLVKRTKTGTTDTTIKSFTATTLIASKSYFTWANSEDGFSDLIQADCATTQSIADDNAIAIRQGAVDIGTVIDSVAWGEAANGLAEGANFPSNPEPGQVLTRVNNIDTDNNAIDFVINNAVPDSNPSVTPAVSAGVVQNFHDGLVTINELVSDPSNGDNEWVELYNTSASPVDINDWTLEDGSGAKTTLTGTIDKFFVIDSPKGSLNNSGDIIILKDEFGVIVDQVIYGEWPGSSNNAPIANSPNSLARKVDGQRSGGYQADWTITTTLTKGSANIINESFATEQEAPKPSTAKSDCPIIITEILPDPLGPDELPSQGPTEFIELYNNSTKEVALENWHLDIEAQKPYLFGKQNLKPGEFLALYAKSTKLKLPNQGATIKLYEPKAEKACTQIKYSESLSGASWGVDGETLGWSKPVWNWSQNPSPGSANTIKLANRAPTAVLNHEAPRLDNSVQFDASDSSDPEADNLSYHWDFGDGTTSDSIYPDHMFDWAGVFQVKLTVSDGQHQVTKSLTLKLGNETTIAKVAGAKVASTKSTKVKVSTVKTTKVTKAKPASLKTIKPKAKLSQASSPTTKTSVASGAKLLLTGTVIVTPRSFSDLYFFIRNSETMATWQIYRQKAELPVLKLGQVISVNGKKSSISNIQRLIINQPSDIRTIGQDKVTETPKINCRDKTAYLGQIVSLSGEVTDKQGESIYLDDGTDEILVRFKTKTGLTADNFNKGESHQIAGLLVQGAKEIELWPRSLADTDLSLPLETYQASSSASNSLVIDETKESNQLSSQLLVVAGVIIIILLISLLKLKLKQKQT